MNSTNSNFSFMKIRQTPWIIKGFDNEIKHGSKPWWCVHSHLGIHNLKSSLVILFS